MVNKDKLPAHLRRTEYTQITVKVPSQVLDDLLDNGIDKASWSSIRDIAILVENDTAPITVLLSSDETVTVSVSYTYKDMKKGKTINLVRHFFLTNRHILYDLAVAVETETSVLIANQEFRFTRKDGLERTYRPNDAYDAVLNMKEVSMIPIVEAFSWVNVHRSWVFLRARRLF